MMPERKAIAEFVQMVEGAAYVEALERFYHPDASTRENNAEPTQGLSALIEKERQMLGGFAKVTARCLSEPVVGEEHVAIPWRFEFVAEGGKSMVLEELAWQEWRDGKIIRERYFYDPGQMVMS